MPMATNGYGLKRMVTASPVSSESVAQNLVPIVTVNWYTNATVKIWWTDSFSKPWLVASTETNKSLVTYISTNNQAFFKLEQL